LSQADKPNTASHRLLSSRQLWLVALMTLLWVLIAVLLLALLSTSLTIYPGVLVFATTALLMVLLIQRFAGSPLHNLNLNACQGRWLLLAVMLAVLFWWADHSITVWLDAHEQQLLQQQWRNQQAAYLSWTVLLGTVVLAPLAEELMFRGLLFNALSRHFNATYVVIITAVLFALIHFNWPAMISVLAGGLLYGWLRLRSGSVLPALLAHVIHNAMTYVLYAAV
jgi:membrane protease YdiL (CAAX protease family)